VKFRSGEILYEAMRVKLRKADLKITIEEDKNDETVVALIYHFMKLRSDYRRLATTICASVEPERILSGRPKT